MVSVKVSEAARPLAARVAVAAIFCLNGLALANWIARIPDAKARLALSDGTLGFVLLFAAIGALIGQPITGWLVGRFGSQRVTTALALVFALTLAPLGMVSSVPQLMAALLVLGIFNGGLDVAMNAQAALVEQAYGRPIMASFHGLWSVGGLAGATLGGAVAAQGRLADAPARCRADRARRWSAGGAGRGAGDSDRRATGGDRRLRPDWRWGLVYLPAHPELGGAHAGHCSRHRDRGHGHLGLHRLPGRAAADWQPGRGALAARRAGRAGCAGRADPGLRRGGRAEEKRVNG